MRRARERSERGLVISQQKERPPVGTVGKRIISSRMVINCRFGNYIRRVKFLE